MESNESIPLRARDWTGTPSTGTTVLAATMPGRCAAPPAPAMITSMPRASAVSAYSTIAAENSSSISGQPSPQRMFRFHWVSHRASELYM